MKIPTEFENLTLYEVLKVNKTATIKEITKAYRKLSLKYHPDKNKSKYAKEQFQFISKIHQILINDNLRKIYDTSGEIPEDDSEEFKSAYEHYRTIFPKFTIQDINKFQKIYEQSDMEKEDILNAYEISKGSLHDIMDCIPFSTIKKIPYYIEIIETNSLQIKNYHQFINKFNKTKKTVVKYVKKQLKESKEAEKLQQDLHLNDKNDLRSLILSKDKQRKNAFDSLLAKYETNEHHKTVEIDDDEFLKIQKQMKKKRRKIY